LQVHFLSFFLPAAGLIFPFELKKKYDFLFSRFPCSNQGNKVKVELNKKKGLDPEEYHIECRPRLVRIYYRDNRGQFYALSTLLQVLHYYDESGMFPAFNLRDRPRLAFRGFMLDVSRGAVPRLETLKKMILAAALLKLNHFSLYLENTFASRLVHPLPGKESYLEKEEIESLVSFAGRCQVELFPSLQMLCHLEKLLERKEFSSFAYTPGSGCLDPGNKRALEWIRGYAAETADLFSSRLVNIGFDECGALTEPEAVKKNLLESCSFFKARGKKIMIWGDMFTNPDFSPAFLPDDVMILNWDYVIEKEEDFSARAAIFNQRSLARQVLCPGTWSWAKFIPAGARAIRNINAAFAAAERNRLAGVMLTSWGDDGNEYLPEGINLSLFHAGNLLWSGTSLNAAAYSLWLKGTEDLDSYRTALFLGQLDQPLAFTHRYYLYEDPLSAPFSRQGDSREAVARYSKAAAYLGKKTGGAHSRYLDFCIRLCRLLAAKIDYSQALPGLLKAGKTNEAKAGCEKLINQFTDLRDVYCELWLEVYKPQGLSEILARFSIMTARYRYLSAILEKRPAEAVNCLGFAENSEAFFSISFKGIFSQ